MRAEEIVNAIRGRLPDALIDRGVAHERAPDWFRRLEPVYVAELTSEPPLRTSLALDPDGLELIPSERMSREVEEAGFEALAWYEPYHLEPGCEWGVYVREEGLIHLVAFLSTHLGTAMPSPLQLVQDAFRMVMRHELFHFLTEVSISFMELAHGYPIYAKYLIDGQRAALSASLVRLRLANESILLEEPARQVVTQFTKAELEEALANAYVQRRPRRRAIMPAVLAFMRTQPRGYRDFGLFAGPGNLAYGKRLLGAAICEGVANTNFFEVLFNVDPEDCLEEVPTFIVRGQNMTTRHLQFAVRRSGMEVEVHPGDHPPPHIHVYKPPGRPLGRYTYPDLKPMMGSLVLPRKDLKNVGKLLDSEPRIGREAGKIRTP